MATDDYVPANTKQGHSEDMAKNSDSSNARNSDKVGRQSMQKPLGKAIKTMRLRLRLTQAQLADRIPGKMNQSYICQLERGDLFPGREHLESLIDALKCSASEIWALAERIAESNVDDCDRDGLLACLGHDRFDHSYEQLVAFDHAAKYQKELSQIVERLHCGAKGAEVSREDVSAFREISDALRLPPLYKKIVDVLCDYVDTYGVPTA